MEPQEKLGTRTGWFPLFLGQVGCSKEGTLTRMCGVKTPKKEERGREAFKTQKTADIQKGFGVENAFKEKAGRKKGDGFLGNQLSRYWGGTEIRGGGKRKEASSRKKKKGNFSPTNLPKRQTAVNRGSAEGGQMPQEKKISSGGGEKRQRGKIHHAK